MKWVRLVRRGGRPDGDYMSSVGRSAALRESVASGAYVVDPDAVAEAMLSRMFVAAQPFRGRPAGTAQDDPGTGLDRSEPGHG